MDLSKLSPAPWHNVGHELFFGHMDNPRSHHQQIWSEPDTEFIALARNAFDVMMRRGWYSYKDEKGKWFVSFTGYTGPQSLRVFSFSEDGFADPFTALVEADRWYRENIECKPASIGVKWKK